jgi:hypothetical protein
MPLIAELKRRNVFRVGAAYAIVAWLLIEVASVVLPALHLPDWTLTFLIIVILAGFPLALIVAWAFELTASRGQLLVQLNEMRLIGRWRKCNCPS